RRHEDDGGLGARLLDRLLDRVEHRQVDMPLAAFAGRHAAYEVGAVCPHLLAVERALVPREALDDDARPLVDEDAHGFPFPAVLPEALRTATTFSAASVRVSAVARSSPLSRRIRLPSSTL